MALILEYLHSGHYQKLPINDALSSQLLDRYLTDLDKSHSYFTIRDIEEFERSRNQLDDDLLAGNLTVAYRIFNRYAQRMTERLSYSLGLLENGIDKLDFNRHETMLVDREDSPWAADRVELDNLWRKRLKNAILNMRLSGKSDKTIAEKLLARYRNQLKQAKQFKSSDVFQFYMNALTGLYDPHTQYFSPRVSENFNINMSLSLEGIGAVLQSKDENTKVLRLVPAGPADKAGQLKPSDIIVGVGQGKKGQIVDVVGWRLDDVVALIRGKKGSVVRLEIESSGSQANNASRIIAITRDKVKLEEQSAKSEIIDIKRDNTTFRVGVISIPTFYADFTAQQAGDPNYRSTTRDVHRLLDELKRERVDGVVIDLRNNGGGSLQEALSLTGLFIQTGPLLQIRDADGQISVHGDRDPEMVYSGPLSVLVNRLSASASEIFAGAIQDYHRGIIIGGQTFGKGTVQALRPLSSGQLKLTQSKFYRVSGASTQNRGVIPDVLYPSFYDFEEIGESALPNALPWDSIEDRHNANKKVKSSLINHLRMLHQQRTTDAIGFEYLIERRHYLDQLKKRETLSLNEGVRRKQRSADDIMQLQLENKRLVSLGREPIKKLADPDEDPPVDENSGKIDINDPLLKESAQIVVDIVLANRSILAKLVPSINN